MLWTLGDRMLIRFIVLAFLYSTSLSAADYSLSKELYMPNESGGYVILTLEECAISEAKSKGYDYRVYATESDSEKPAAHEGCWNSPDVSEAPNMPGVTIVPLVNIWIEGDMITLPQNLFSQEKRRWSPTVRPNV